MPAGLQRLLDTLRASAPGSAQEARDLVQRCEIERDALARWCAFDHPATDGYGRRMVAQGDAFEVLVMSWRPGDWSAIHDHGCAGWGAVQVFGALQHTTFSLRERTLAVRTEAQVEACVLPIDGGLVHQLGNPCEAPRVSLHVYGGAGEGGPVTAGSRVFDLWTGEVQWTDGGVFHCLPEADVSRREPGLTGDGQATALHRARLKTWLEAVARREPLPPELAALRALVTRPPGC